jgi:transposase
MKKSRYTGEQIVRILREADRLPITDVSKRYGVSEASIYAWRKRFGGMDGPLCQTSCRLIWFKIIEPKGDNNEQIFARI